MSWFWKVTLRYVDLSEEFIFSKKVILVVPVKFVPATRVSGKLMLS